MPVTGDQPPSEFKIGEPHAREKANEAVRLLDKLRRMKIVIVPGRGSSIDISDFNAVARIGVEDIAEALTAAGYTFRSR